MHKPVFLFVIYLKQKLFFCKIGLPSKMKARYNYFMEINKVGIIKGGDENYEFSIKKGGEIFSHIFENLSSKWKPLDIFIDKKGNWHLSGIPIDPKSLRDKVDVVWNLAHPAFSAFLKDLSIPVIGPDSFSHYLKHNRKILEKHLKNAGFKMPKSIIFPAYQKDFDGPENEYAILKAKEVHGKFGAPWIVRTYIKNDDMGIHVAKTFPELVEAIKNGLKTKESILVEELISGRPVSVHLVKGFRGKEKYVFPISIGKKSFLNADEKEKIIQLVNKLHSYLNSEYYFNAHFLVASRDKIYVTHISFHPELHSKSHFFKACELVGAKTHHVIDHMLSKVRV